jgi:hypothetical protein
MPNMRFGGSSCCAFVGCWLERRTSTGCVAGFSAVPVEDVLDDDAPDEEVLDDEALDGEVLDDEGLADEVDDAVPGAAGFESAAGAGGSSAGVLDPFCAASDETSTQTISAIHSVHWERMFIRKRSLMLTALDPERTGPRRNFTLQITQLR